jgi:vacuolar protein sorting-associated protein IST1
MQSTDPPPASVPPRILSKLALYTPPQELVDAYLGEIAKSYGVPYESAHPIEAMDDEGKKGDDDGPGEGQEKEEAKVLEIVSAEDGKKSDNAQAKKDEGVAALPELPSTTPEAPPKKVNEDDELAKRFERLKNLK